jgi:pimeloyl-ACP methyl ester carboxylesterase
LAGICLLLGGCLGSPEPDAQAHDSVPPQARSQARGVVHLDIHGYQVLADVQGNWSPGAPVVVFDSGAGETHEDWQEAGVQQGIAQRALTISYDRAGLGGSEENGLPKIADVQARQLRLLLDAAGLPPPYVLVSHSIAGLNARVFNDLYPQDVFGVVFVDSSHERQDEGYWKALSMIAAPASNEMAYEEFQATARLAENGRSADLLRDKPISVLTATCHFVCGANVPEPTQEDWHEFQRDIASLSDFQVHQVAAPGQGHYLMIDAPQLVIDAIWDVIKRGDEARRN